jgi:glycosyltransferase involved in cell wall biosynthesis
LNILHINASYKPAFVYGGPTMSVSMLSEQLARAGNTVSVFTTTANGENELTVTAGKPINVDGVNVTYFKRVTKDHTHFSPSLLTKLWKEAKNYDLVHIHAWWNLVSVLSTGIALARGIQVVVSARGTLSPYSFSNKNTGIKSIIHTLLGKPLLKKCHLHVTSKREKRTILKLIQPKSISILPNLVKLPTYTLSAEKEPGPLLKVIFLSRIEEKKGLDILLNALLLVNIPYSLTIAGNGDAGYINYLKGIAAANHVTDKINWVAFRDENKFDLLREHDLFVLPSHDENFGNVVIESLGVGTAVLISQNVGLADYVIENDLGWICETSAESVGMSINTIGGNHKTDLNRIRKQAPQIIYKDFDPDNLVQGYTTMYNELIKHDRL